MKNAADKRQKVRTLTVEGMTLMQNIEANELPAFYRYRLRRTGTTPGEEVFV